jgi:hypothetical protein
MSRFCAALFFVSFAAIVCAADPFAGYFYPPGIQAGTTNRIIVGGQAIRRLGGIHFDAKGLRVLGIETVPAFSPPAGMQRKHLVKWLDGIAAGDRNEPPRPDDPHLSEWRSNSWWRILGELDSLKLSIVERNLFVPRNIHQCFPALSQMAIVTVVAAPDAKPGVCSAWLWDNNGISAPHPFLVSKEKRVAERLYAPPHRPAVEPQAVEVPHGGIVLDGQIMPGETDSFRLRLEGGVKYRFGVTARGLQPYIGDAVPGFFNPAIVVRDGKGAAVAAADDRARFRPDPALNFRPKKSGVYTVEIHDVLYRGRVDFVYAISVFPCVDPPAAAGLTSSRNAADGKGGIFRGVVSKPGAVSKCTFSVDVPGTRVFEVSARSRGSSLDAVLALRRESDGKVLAVWDDVTNRFFVGTIPQAECDPRGRYDFAESRRYTAEISDRTGHGGAGYFWKLAVREPKPDFRVYSTRSALPLYRGATRKVDFVVERIDGFGGDITLEFPKRISAKNNVFTGGVERISAEIKYNVREKVDCRPIEIFARSEVGGKTVRRKVMPCDECEQAFAWTHLVPAKTFLMRVLPWRKPAKKK